MLALELGVVGLMNVQFAVKGGEIYVLEVNPRASRTVPFVSKATGRPLAQDRRDGHGRARRSTSSASTTRRPPRYVAVKESVFPFQKFPGADTILGPEMRSTGEVMGIADTFARAFGKGCSRAAGSDLRDARRVARRAFISVRDEDKPAAIHIARRLRAIGLRHRSRRRGTAAMIRRARIPCDVVNKVNEGSPHVVDAIRAHESTSSSTRPSARAR